MTVVRETDERALLHEAHRVARLVSWEYDPRSGTVELSRELADVAGSRVPRATTLDRVLELLAPADAQMLRERLARVGAGEGDGGTIMESELVQPERNLDWALPLQATRWVATRMRAIRDPSGALTGGVHGTTQDITARKLADLAGRESEQRLREAQHIGEVGSFEIDCRTRLVTWSPQLYRLFAVQAGTCSGDLDFLLGLIPVEAASELARLADAMAQDGRPRELGHRYLRGDELRYAETRLEPLDSGLARGVRGTLRDVTVRRLAQDEVHVRGQLLDAVDAAVIATDLHAIVTHWSRGAEQLYGWTRAETVGRPLRSLTLDAGGPADGRRLLERVVAAGPAEVAQELARRDGRRFQAQVRTSLLTDARGAPAGVIAVTVDRGGARREAGRSRRATRDAQRAVTEGTNQGVYTVDGAGRLIHMNRAAQQLLGWTFAELEGRRMHEAVSPGDASPFRPAYERGVPVRIDDDVLIRKDGTRLQVAISASPFRTDDGQLEAVVVFTDIGDRRQSERRLLGEVERVSWVTRIRDALDAERLVVYAQPLLDLATGAGAGHELLVRMQGDGGELIPPALFLPAAEQYGLVADIDRWMLGQAVELAAQGHAVAVNLSPRTVRAGRITADLQGALAGAGADPALLVIEITEAALAGHGPAAARLIDGVRETGCGLALDHFGTGQGGFTYLRRLPFDYLKIDAEFVRDLPANAASQDVIRAIVHLARGFGQRTVAEGVESEGTLELLRDLGVDLAQGFAIGRPAPAPDVFGAGPCAWRRRSIV
jgi:PAS domain S-box-containing protein